MLEKDKNFIDSRRCAKHLLQLRGNSAIYYHALSLYYDRDKCCDCVWDMDEDTCIYFQYREKLRVC